MSLRKGIEAFDGLKKNWREFLSKKNIEESQSIQTDIT